MATPDPRGKDPELLEMVPIPLADSEGDDSTPPENEANFHRSIDNRQMVFLSLAGSIGAGLFVASGSALSSGGGGNAVLNYAVVGFMICTTMGSLGELASMFLLPPNIPHDSHFN